MKKKIEINWQPDKKSNVPLYKQIVDYFYMMIVDGNWSLGSPIPSQRELALLFDVNRSTIVTAMDELIANGIIETGYGRGSIITNNTWPVLVSNVFTNWRSYISAGSFKSNHATIQTINKLEFEDYVRLGTGELSPQLFPRKYYNQVIQTINDELVSLNYLGALGLLELRQELVKLLARQGIIANEKQILITSGSLQALQLISICMLNKDSIVYTEAPSYVKSLQVFQSSGVKLVPITMDEEGINYWQINSNIIKDHKNNQLIYTIPDFQNPTSISMSDSRRKELLDYSQKNNLPIIEDSAYSELWFDSRLHKPLKAMENNNVLYIGTVSKTLAPGLRVGWVVGPEAVIERLGDVKMQIDYGASSISQLIVKEFFKSGLYDKHLTNIRQELKKRRDNAITIIMEYLGDKVTFKIPQGGFYIWLEFKEKIAVEKIFQKALEKKILLNPGNIYDFNENNCLRISYSYESIETFNEAVKTLAKIINNLEKDK